ncbi:transglycosylase domain-containing protein [Variovorax sp. RHLX14]|uniref:biosynthetic peptidoglycan transglycosylase n=1 Tax=Variovorax sp. RHLX14 TaxID=1259731 RepID=UPI003F44DC29
MKRTLRFLLFALLALVVTSLVALILIARLLLAPATGEWMVPWRLGPVTLDVGVPTTMRLLTSPWLAPRLAGFDVDTRYGPVRLGWEESSGSLMLDCAPCSAPVPALGSQPLRVAQLTVTVRRDGNRLFGRFDAKADKEESLRGRWDGRLSQTSLQIDADIDDAPLTRWYAVLAPDLQELRQARIGGSLAMHGRVVLPAGELVLQPRVSQFRVEGLGTEAVVGARSNSCGPSARLANDSWLARAVVAAEDQRFFTHPGYDLVELGAAASGNHKTGAVERGASTVTQQLAKLLFTGSERSSERKLRELLYAVEMEETLGKARILQLYLDNAPWGGTVCGAEAASRRYFGRSARALEPAQAVWLAAMLHKPSAELAEWRRTGSIDAARAKWVAEGIRGISRNQREALLGSIATARFAPPP